MTDQDKKPRLIERVAADLPASTLPSLDRLINGPHQPPAPRQEAAAARPVAPIEPVGFADGPDSVRVAAATRSPLRHDIAERQPGTDILTEAALEEIGMISLASRRSRVGEQFRVVRQLVLDQFAAGAAETHGRLLRNVVMITSARGGEGKSFAALNLARMLAEGHTRNVVLVDGDVGKGSLSERLKFDAHAGLLDLALSPRQFGLSAAVPSEIENLRFLPIGGGRNAESRLAASAHQPIRSLIENVAVAFEQDLVVVDMAACLESSDPVELAGVVGQIVLVVEAGRTRKRDVEGALDLLDPCPNISLLLNRARWRPGGTFGAGR